MEAQSTFKSSDAGSSHPNEEPYVVPLSDENENEEDDLEGFVEECQVGNDNTIDTQTGSGKRTKKLTSDCWEFFDVVTINGVQKAKCKYCKRALSYNGKNGTSHLKKHARESCPGRHLKLAAGQSTLKVSCEVDGKPSLVVNEKPKKVAFDQEVSRRELVRMVIIHEYPLSMVDHMGFRSFVKSLNENFKMISRNTLKSDVMKLYNTEKVALRDLMEANESRVAITTDMWTASNQKKGYMAVTSHFIDHNWILHNRTIRFCFVPCPHTKGVIAKILMETLSQFSLENKISSIVVDNCTRNDAMMNVLMDKLESSCLVLNGAFLHMRCSAHILNLIVKDGLQVIDNAIGKVRECVAFWMSTPKRIEKFEEACRLLNVKNVKVGLDCKTRWNSTYLMIDSSLPFKDVFNKLKRLNKRLKFSLPSDDDWSMATLVCQKLEVFYKATKVFSIRKHPTANLFFRTICEIRLCLNRWVVEDENEIIRTMAKSMSEKFDKYWSQINGILAVAAILDPRNKMDFVAHYFGRLYGDDTDSEMERVRRILDNLVREFESKNEEVNDHSQLKRGFNECGNEDSFAKSKRQKFMTRPLRSEVDRYLEAAPMAKDNEFDVLEWWKVEKNYPTLKKIAKDILAIPVSSVASESAFSMGGRVVSAHRSRLHSQTVEALMCLQSWMIDDVKGDLEGKSSYSTITEDYEDNMDAQGMDVIEMDVDDISSDED